MDTRRLPMAKKRYINPNRVTPTVDPYWVTGVRPARPWTMPEVERRKLDLLKSQHASIEELDAAGELHDSLSCPACDGPLVYFGTLGILQHFNCRNCGLESHKPL